MESESCEERARTLAKELKEILQTYLLEDPKVAEPHIEKAKGIKAELESMGFLVEWKSRFNPQTFEFKVDVTLWKPKENLSPENQAIYDQWFLERQKIKSGPAEASKPKITTKTVQETYEELGIPTEEPEKLG